SFDGELGIENKLLIGGHYSPGMTSSLTITTTETNPASGNNQRKITTTESLTKTVTDLRFWSVIGGHQLSYQSEHVTTSGSLDSLTKYTNQQAYSLSRHEDKSDSLSETEKKAFGFVTYQSKTENHSSSLTEIELNQGRSTSLGETSSVSVDFTRNGDKVG